ncbi:MAG: oxidoreductase [Salibacteraceae bacterium]
MNDKKTTKMNADGSKVVLVTGASSGIGKSAAKLMLEKGHTVYGAARRIELMRDLEQLGMRAIKMDITNPSDVESAVNQIMDESKRIDALVNNAGYAVYGAVEDTPIDDAKKQFEVNLFGLAQLTKTVIPHMRKAHRGRIINISSMAGKMYTPMGAWYHASKHALEGWSDCLRIELKPFGIDVVIIEPGVIKTNFDQVMLDPLMKRSGSGPYAEMAMRMVETSRKIYSSSWATPPDTIGKLILRTVETRKPKTRYRKGFMAKPGVFIRTYLGDRIWDSLMNVKI